MGERLHLDLLAPLVATKNAFLPGLPNPAAAAAVPVVVLVAMLLWRRSLAALWLLTCGLSGLFAIFLLKHSAWLRHHGLVLVFRDLRSLDRLGRTAGRTTPAPGPVVVARHARRTAVGCSSLHLFGPPG
ncbi:MAG: hypothetical protein IPI34_15010 [bacterium]|nr:hypothetical protein [bacterium]